MTPHLTHLRAVIVETPQQKADRLLAEDREQRALQRATGTVLRGRVVSWA